MARENTASNPVARLIRMDAAMPRLILVVGDAMTDVYVSGRMEDNCQEGCPKFVEEGRVTVPGGSTNATRSLENWNTKAVHYSVHGSGPRKTRFMVGSICAFRYDDDVVGYDQSVVRKATLDILLRDRNCPSAVLLSDYDKGTLTPEFIVAVVDQCRALRIPCVVDCKRAPETYTGCILKCNSDYQHRYNNELSELIFNNFSCESQRLVVTGGEMNPIIWDGAGPLGLGYSLPPVPCANHVGSGDCFAAHLALALAHGFTLRDAAAVAHSAGRVYVQRAHNQPPRPEDVAADAAGRPRNA